MVISVLSCPAQAGRPVIREVGWTRKRFGVLDRPLEPAPAQAGADDDIREDDAATRFRLRDRLAIKAL
jgi:hypothetical protein